MNRVSCFFPQCTYSILSVFSGELWEEGAAARRYRSETGLVSVIVKLFMSKINIVIRFRMIFIMYTGCGKYYLLKVFCSVLSNRLEFQSEILLTYLITTFYFTEIYGSKTE